MAAQPLVQDFNTVVSPAVPDGGTVSAVLAAGTATAFEKSLAEVFPRATVQEVTAALKSLQVPLPENDAQYLRGQDGLLIFSSLHGVVLRIEKQDGKGYEGAGRAHDSAWMLQPLGAVAAGQAVVEIMPGVSPGCSDAESRRLYWKLWADGYQYWDERTDNAGRLPFASPQFPEGVPVIVDRLSVARLSRGTQPAFRALEVLKGTDNRLSFRSPLKDPAPEAESLRAEFAQMRDEMLRRPRPVRFETKYDQQGYEAFLELQAGVWDASQDKPEWTKVQEFSIPLLRAMNALTSDNNGGEKPREAEDPQEILYGPLRRAFKAAWPSDAPVPSREKMADFWGLVLDAHAGGKLVSGWNAQAEKEDGTKYTRVPKIARAYEPLALRIGR